MSTVTVVVVDSGEAGGEGVPALAMARAEMQRDGARVSTTPDGRVQAVFESAGAAVAAATRLLAGIAGEPTVAVGIDVGEITAEDEELYSVAARVADELAALAPPGRILATGVLQALLGRRGDIEFGRVDDLGLDGPGGSIDVVEVHWSRLDDSVPIRVVVADDAGLIRSGIVQLLASSGCVITGEAADFDGLLAAVESDPPDLVVTDIRMPPTNTDEGLRAAVEIRRRYPEIGIVVLSQYIEVAAATGLLTGSEGGIGYLLKERVSDLNEFVDACRRVAAGGSVIDPIVTDRLMNEGGRGDVLERLSEREREVLGLMAQGKSNGAIAAELFVGAKTVETHVRSVFQKLELAETPEGNRRVQAVLEWLRAAPPPPA